MKIAISADGDKLHSKIDQRFGRCKYFLIVNVNGNGLPLPERYLMLSTTFWSNIKLIEIPPCAWKLHCVWSALNCETLSGGSIKVKLRGSERKSLTSDNDALIFVVGLWMIIHELLIPSTRIHAPFK